MHLKHLILSVATTLALLELAVVCNANDFIQDALDAALSIKNPDEWASLAKRWWSRNDNKENAGKCGPNAPLYNGLPAICDPKDPEYHCCSSKGRCGTGKEFCDCPGCVNHATGARTSSKRPK